MNSTLPQGSAGILHSGTFATDPTNKNGLGSTDGLTFTISDINGVVLATFVSTGATFPGTLSQTGDLTVNTGNIIANTAGYGLKVKEGTNGRMAEVTLVAGTVTVANTSVTANTRIFHARKTAGGSVGTLTYTVSAGVGYTLTSSSNTDTSVIDCLLVEPA